jgi:hypothetical protein
MLTNEYDNILEFSRLCNGEKAGNKISLLFNPHRLDTKRNDCDSIITGFKDDSFLSGLARATIFKNGKVNELLYQILQLCINGSGYVNEFPPFVAVNFYKTSRSKNPRILDPCAGWGGRMIGAAAVGGFYHGFDPSEQTCNGLSALGDWLKQFKTGFDYVIEKLPYEDSTVNETFDIALTSPPYYDTERYSDDEEQSFKRYRTYKEWVSGFFSPLIMKTMERLKDDGSFIINVGDRQYPLSRDLFSIWSNAIEIKSKLSGGGGLGREEDGKERFYLLRK